MKKNSRDRLSTRPSVFNGGRAALAGAAALALTGCASGPQANPNDPLEPFNRSMYNFNDALDQAVLKPIASAYETVTPSMVRAGVRNFFANLGDVWSFVNNVLQLKAEASVETFMRVNVNTLFGLGGLIDVASDLRLERHKEDFGQTLGYWGMPPGPYLVLPLLGSSTVRDTAALPVDTYGDLVRHIDDERTRYSLYALRLVETRASLLGASGMLDEAALDKYSFTRDAYLQMRRSQVYDGNPPSDPDPAP